MYVEIEGRASNPTNIRDSNFYQSYIDRDFYFLDLDYAADIQPHHLSVYPQPTPSCTEGTSV